MIGQNLRASEIPLGGSIKLVSPAEQVIAHVVALKAEELETPAEGASLPAAAEPEVIKKGKKEEEGEAEPEKGRRRNNRRRPAYRGLAGASARMRSSSTSWSSVSAIPARNTSTRRTIWGFWWSTGWRSATESRSAARIRWRWWGRERWRVRKCCWPSRKRL